MTTTEICFQFRRWITRTEHKYKSLDSFPPLLYTTLVVLCSTTVDARRSCVSTVQCRGSTCLEHTDVHHHPSVSDDSSNWHCSRLHFLSHFSPFYDILCLYARMLFVILYRATVTVFAVTNNNNNNNNISARIAVLRMMHAAGTWCHIQPVLDRLVYSHKLKHTDH